MKPTATSTETVGFTILFLRPQLFALCGDTGANTNGRLRCKLYISERLQRKFTRRYLEWKNQHQMTLFLCLALPTRGNRREAAIRCNNSWRTDGIRLRGVENVPMEWQRYFRLRTESEIWCDDSRFWEAKLLIFRKKWVKMPVPNPVVSG